MIAAGKLNKRVKIYSIPETSDGMGGIEEGTLTESTETWGSVIPLRGKRLLEYSEIVKGRWYDFTIRKRESISLDEDYILSYDSKYLTIHQIWDEDERGLIMRGVAYERRT